MIRMTQREREALERREDLDRNDEDDRELLRLDAAELFASTTWLARAARDEITDVGGGQLQEPLAEYAYDEEESIGRPDGDGGSVHRSYLAHTEPELTQEQVEHESA